MTNGDVNWKDADKIRRVITEEIPAEASADKAYRNAMRRVDPQNPRIEHDKAWGRVVVELVSDHTELFKQFMENVSFKRWLSDNMFRVTYEEPIANPPDN